MKKNMIFYISLITILMISVIGCASFPKGTYQLPNGKYEVTENREYWQNAQASQVKLWLKKIINVKQREAVKNTALKYAARHSNLELCKALLEQGADINDRHGKNRDTAAMYAIRFTNLDRYSTPPNAINIELFEFLIDSGTDLELHHVGVLHGIDSGSVSLLAYAAGYAAFEKHGYKEVVEILLDRGADIEGSGGTYTPLEYAAINGSVDIMKTLLAHGADIEGKKSANEFTPLQLAAAHSRPEALAFLLENGADPLKNADPDEVSPPIILASRNRRSFSQELHAETVRILLDNGADPEVRDKTNQLTPLVFAARAGAYQTVKLLLEQGVDVNAQGNKGGTALIFAAASNDKGSFDVVKALLDAGADPYFQYEDGRTAIKFCNSYRKRQIIEEAISSGGIDRNNREYFKVFEENDGLVINTSGIVNSKSTEKKGNGAPGINAGNIEVWLYPKNIENYPISFDIKVKARFPKAGMSTPVESERTFTLEEGETLRIIAVGGDGGGGENGEDGRDGYGRRNGGNGEDGYDGGDGGDGGDIIFHIPQWFTIDQPWLIIDNHGGKGGWPGEGGRGGYGGTNITYKTIDNEIIKRTIRYRNGIDGFSGISGKAGQDGSIIVYKDL